MEWKSCEEDGYPPNDNTEVLFFTINEQIFYGYYSDHCDPPYFFDCYSQWSLNEVTHWMDFEKIQKPLIKGDKVINEPMITNDEWVMKLIRKE